MLKNKTALITGASRGIGRAIAQLYAEHGCNIAFTYIYEEQEANNLVEQLQAKGVQVLCIHSDAADFNGGFRLGLCLGHIAKCLPQSHGFTVGFRQIKIINS